MKTEEIRVLTVIPGEAEGNSMIFSKKEVIGLNKLGLNVQPFFLSSRTSIKELYKESIRFKKVQKEFKPHLVHCHFGTVTSFFCFLFSKRPFIITFHGSDLNFCNDRSYIRNIIAVFLSHFSSLFAKRIICVSTKLQNKLTRFAKKKSTVIPACVDTDEFKTIEITEARNFLKLSLDPEKKYVLFNASNPIIKRLDIAEKVETLLKEKFDVEFIYLKGNIENNTMPYYLNASNVLLLCSDTEGSPVIIKEAMACNLPIVSVDVGDVAKNISGVSNSFIVKQEINEIAKKLEDVLIKNERSNGRTVLIEKKLTQKDALEKIINLYKEIIENR